MSDQDQMIACKDCNVDFEFTAGEAAFYADKGFQTPRRCKPCRALKKARAQEDTRPAMSEPSAPEQVTPARRKGGRRDDRDERY